MKLKAIVVVILILAIAPWAGAAEEEKPKKKKIDQHIKEMFRKFGENSKTEIRLIAGPKEVKMRNGGVEGKQWLARCEDFEFKLTIETATGVKIEQLVERVEKLPVPYMSACQAVSDETEDGVAIYKSLNGAAGHGGQGYINIVPGAGSLVIAHEAGHTLEQVARKADEELVKKWTEASKADDISVSGYGDTAWSEDIAEFSKAYAVCMDAGDGQLELLKELSPKRFELWEKVLYLPPQRVSDKKKDAK